MPYLQERDDLNNLLASFVDVKRKHLVIDNDQMSDETARFRNLSEANKYMVRKSHGLGGIARRSNQHEMRKLARMKRNLSKQTLLLNESHPAFSPSKRSVFVERRSLLG